jgi:hypothetical protein
MAFVMVFAAMTSSSVQAAGKKKTQAPQSNGKRVVAVEPIQNIRIEMPDGNFHDFGSDFYSSLTAHLDESGKYITADKPNRDGTGASARSRIDLDPPPGYEWPSSVVPAATVKMKVEALTFQTGSRGERMYYGFDERFRTPYNNGYEDLANEFPLRTVSFEPNWFDRFFDGRGKAPFDSHSGLDIGDGFHFNVYYVWMAVKYALYRSELRIRMDIDAPLAGRHEYRTVHIKGNGYFFDVAGAYLGYSAGIRVARQDAMERALKNAIDGAYDAIDRALSDLPLTARVDAILPDGLVLLGSGKGADIKNGVIYEIAGDPSVRLEVVGSTSSGAIAQVVKGSPSRARPGVIVREAIEGMPAPMNGVQDSLSLEAPPGLASSRSAARTLGGSIGVEPVPGEDGQPPAAIEDITLPWKDLSQANLDGLAPVISWGMAFLKSLGGMAFLPYRIMRYMSYDQAYKASVQEDGMIDDPAHPYEGAWAGEARASAWGHQIGLDQAPVMSAAEGREKAPVVAVIDSGIDYNHWTLHSHLWLNPNASSIDGAGASGAKDRYGWDFVSGDSRPFDDGYHGTEVASLVSAVAPFARIMPVKVFNPWGITSSAAMLGAFRYAVDHGAKIIVCGWATRLASGAIRDGVRYARDHGVAVVAAAGDRGDKLSEVGAYPAALAATHDNVLVVSGVDSKDQLVAVSGRYSNFDATLVGLSAPGQAIQVSTPRGGSETDTSTALSAGMVAGALARLLADPALGAELAAQAPSAWFARLREEADVIPGLEKGVQGGLRLRVRH